MLKSVTGSPDTLSVATARDRETAANGAKFKQAMQNGAQVLLSGAQVASEVVGSPLLSAAISKTQVGAAGILGQDGISPDPLSGLSPTLPSVTNSSSSEDMKLLALQDQIQRENRYYSLLSNVIKARHETAKNAISNLRS